MFCCLAISTDTGSITEAGNVRLVYCIRNVLGDIYFGCWEWGIGYMTTERSIKLFYVAIK